jgi:hypothetical protein
MANYFDLIFVSPEQILPILAALVLWILLAGLGSFFTASDRFVEANVIFGWAVISGIFTIIGVFVRQPFFVIACAALLVSLISIYRLSKVGMAPFLPGMWRVLILALPLLWIAGAMEPSQWDEFSHWLPAQKYLIDFNGFPYQERPFSGPPMLPGYPFGWPFLGYLSAIIAGKFIHNVTSTLNILLLLSFSTFAIRVASEIIRKKIQKNINWSIASLIVLFATIFNPTFIQKIVLTAYSDVSTSVLVGFSVLLGFYFVEILANRRVGSSWSCAWQLSLTLSLLANVRQANILLVLIILASVTILVLRDPGISTKKFLKHVFLVFFPIIVVYFSWRYHVTIEFMSLSGAEAGLRPFDQWNFNEISQILMGMGHVAFKKIGFFGPMLLATYLGIKGLYRLNRAFDRIVFLFGSIFIAYTSFMFLAYLGHFEPRQAAVVQSFWRYSGHNGMVAVSFIIIGTFYFIAQRPHLSDIPHWLKVTALVLVVTLPFAFAHKLRFDLEQPKPHFIAVAKSLITLLPKNVNMFVMDPKGTGESAKITYFYLNILGLGYLSAFGDPTPDRVRKSLEIIESGGYLLVHSSIAGLSEIVKVKLKKNKSYLFRKGLNNWQSIREWKKPRNYVN